MPTLTESRTVPTPRPEAFAYVADFSNIEEWDPGVASSKKTSSGELGVGSTFDLKVKFGSTEAPMTYTITDYQPNERVVLAGTGKRITAIDTIAFRDADDGGTVIDYEADLEFKGLLKLLAPFMGGRLDEIGRKAVDGMQEALTP